MRTESQQMLSARFRAAPTARWSMAGRRGNFFSGPSGLRQTWGSVDFLPTSLVLIHQNFIY